jgi:DNA polymerase III psi subunit
MKIDPNFLTQIFEKDLLYVLPGEEAKAISIPENETASSSSPVSVPDEPIIVEEEAVSYDGSFNKKVLVVISDSASDADRDFLMNVLKAIQLTIDDIGIITSADKTQWHQLSPNRIINFQAITTQEFYTVSEENGIQHLYAHTLSEISQDVNLKKQLWVTLKQAFL